MAFSLPSDLSTSWADDSSVIYASDWNNFSAMGNAIKAAIGTIGYGTRSTVVSASETTTSTSYVDLVTTTDSVTVAVGSSGSVLLMFGATATNSGQNYCYIGYDVSGANTIAASDANCIQAPIGTAGVSKYVSNVLLLSGLTPGFTTFKLKYKVNTGTGTFTNRRISAIPMPSTDGTHANDTFNLNASISMGMLGSGFNRPTYDASATAKSDSASSLSWTHTAAAGSLVLVGFTRGYAGGNVTAVTYGGAAMTFVGSVAQNNSPGDSGTMYLYTINDATGGAKTVVTTWTSAATASAISISYVNAATVALSGSWTDYGSSASPSTVVTNTGNQERTLVNFMSIRGGGVATITSASATQRAISQPASKYYDMVAQEAKSVGSNTFGVTATGGSPYSWASATVEVLANVPTYTKPVWAGTGIGYNRGANPGGSWVDTIPADANLALVWVSELPSDQANTCTVTMGGTSMVEMTGSPWNYDFSSGWMRLRCFYLQNPPVGPNKTIAITSNVSNYFHAHSVYYGGVSSVGTATFVRGTSGATLSTAISNSLSTHMYAQGFIFRPEGATSTVSSFTGANMRAVHNNGNGGYTNPLAVGDAYGNDGTLSISATRSNSLSNAWGSVTIDLSPSALPTPVTPTFVGLGAGRPHVSGNYSWTETVPANANCAILWISALGTTAVSATLGGTAMTHIQGSPFLYNSAGYSIQALYLLNPSTGANKTLALTNANANNVHAVVTYYGGVTSIANPTSVSTGAAGEQPAISVSNTTNDHLYVNSFAFRPNAGWDAVTVYDKNRRIDYPNYSYDAPIIVGDAVGNGTTLTFNGTRNNTTYPWGGVAVDLSPTVRQASFNLSLTSAVGFSARSSGAVTFDSVGAGFVNATATAPSWTHNIGANAKALIVVATFYNNGLVSPTFTNAKVGTTDLVLLGKYLNFTTGGWNTYTAYLGCVNPPTGTQTVTFTTGSAYIGAQSFAYNNVKTIDVPVQVSTANVSTGPSAPIVAASTSSDDMVIASVSGYTSVMSSITPNQRHKNDSTLCWIVGDSNGTNGNVTITGTISAATLYGAGYINMRANQLTTPASFNLAITPAIQMASVQSNVLSGPVIASVATAESTSSGTFTDLTTTTDQVTVTVPSSGMVLVTITADSSTGGYRVGYAMSGANTRAADDYHQFGSINSGNAGFGASFLETGLTPGSTTFKMKYIGSGGSFSNRRISVTPVLG